MSHQRSFVCFMDADDGLHAWLSVFNEDIRRLEIAERFKGQSYMTLMRSYLSLPYDAAVFTSAAKDRGWTIKVQHAHFPVTKAIRRCGAYDSYWIDNQLDIDSVCSIAGHNVIVRHSDKQRFFLSMTFDTDIRWTISKRNCYKFVDPPRQTFNAL